MRIAVDGPVGSGKTTVALKLAQKLGFDFLSTGLMYRYVGLLAECKCKGVENLECLQRLVKGLDFQLQGDRLLVCGEPIGSEVRSECAGELASKVAVLPERAKRKYEEMKAAGLEVSYEEILKQIKERDQRDATREIAPLKPADDACIVDTTGKSVDQVVEEILRLLEERRVG